MTTFFPISLLFGVYVNVNGDIDEVTGVTEPSPFSVIVTLVVPPPKVLPLTVTGVVAHVLPLVLLSETVGGFTHCPDTSDEINKKRLTKRKTLVIFFLNNIDGKLRIYYNISVVNNDKYALL
jgi:hypothetical protein